MKKVVPAPRTSFDVVLFDAITVGGILLFAAGIFTSGWFLLLA